MKASETRFARVVEGTNQYMVPHYQRPYTWAERHWKQLWSDITDILDESAAATDEHPSRQHFIGSLVTAQGQSVPEGVSKWILIDGQQRMTTLLILLVALRDHAKTTGLERLAAQIQNLYLTNPYQDGLDRYKLLPTADSTSTGGDRAAFVALVDEAQPHDCSIVRAYRFFRQRLALRDAPEPEQLRQALVGNLVLVSIVLDRTDNPYLVFESLNATGEKLTQADLIRNYFFMRLPVDQHPAIYAERWRPIEDSIGSANTPEFFRHYLTRLGSVVKVSDVYFELKRKIEDKPPNEVRSLLDELKEHATVYSRFLEPSREPDEDLRAGLVALNRLEATVAYPFLLNVYDAYRARRIERRDFLDILGALENFIIRRYVCRAPRSELNKIFPVLYRNAQNHSSLAVGVREVLATRGYPSDALFAKELRESQLYGAGERRERTKFILERLERAHGHKEAAVLDSLTIEHVMPQTLTDWWTEHLGDECSDTHSTLLHSIGNLTLTGMNSEMSNLPFPEKQRVLRSSALQLNRYFESCSRWGEVEIEARAQQLAERALSIWPHLSPSGETAPFLADVTGRTPRTVTLYGRVLEVSTWQAVLAVTLTEVALLGSDLVEQIAAEIPRYISRSDSQMRTPRRLCDGYWYESHLNAKQIANVCRQATQIAGMSSRDWVVDVTD
jgi:uncharacterized protein with ParB-like and HNH nuclease domain